MRRGGAIAAAACLLALSACSSSDEDDKAVDRDDAVTEDVAEGTDAPTECLEAYIGAAGGADLDDVESMPDDWPQAPEGSTLCVTAEGGSVETASYASTTPVEEILAYYEQQLAAAYEVYRVSGEENGTGYDSLDGSGEAVAFQVRESDGGFVIAFVAGDATEGENQ